MFGFPTDGLIWQAARKRRELKKLTKDEELLMLLSDGGWHSSREIAIAVTHRFSGSLFRLKKLGVRYEKVLDPHRPPGAKWWDYRLLRDGE